MDNWRDPILREFTPGVANLTLVADPDSLLTEEGIFSEISNRGFDVVPYDDDIALRFAYETRFRSRWDRGEDANIIVVVREGTGKLKTLPYDLLENGRKLDFTLGELFPNLSYPVIASLDLSDLDALYEAQKRHNPGNLGDNATKDFALRHVFEIAPELIKQPSDLLRVLLRRHYRGRRVPGILDERFIQVLRQGNQFKDWPLEEIVPDRSAFFLFLQERWPFYVKKLIKQEDAQEGFNADCETLHFPGPIELPFDHDDVRVYIDNLFLEGLLKPIGLESVDSEINAWVSRGLIINQSEDLAKRFESLLQSVKTTIPSLDADYQEWIGFANRFGELITLQCRLILSDSCPEESSKGDIRRKIDEAFMDWVRAKYHSLYNQPPTFPVMVHHIPRYIARCLGHSKNQKAALIVVDGMAIDQWIPLREELNKQLPEIRFQEAAAFAWIPSTTAVSRQAIFSGKAPFFFSSSITETDKDEQHWLTFWQDQGLSKETITFKRNVMESNLDEVLDLLSFPKVRVAGLIVNKVDKIMQGMQLGTAGMHSHVQQWGAQGFMGKLFSHLLELGFRIFITSDHGNIEATGIGCPSEGVVADLRGERVRIYRDKTSRDRTKEVYTSAIEWPNIGLPEDYFPLLASNRTAFTRECEEIVCHGSISVEELIVPFVEVVRSSK